MLDDLRNSAANPTEPPDQLPVSTNVSRRRKSTSFLGMSAGQRFVIVLLLFLMSCVMGMACLVLTGKIYLPFF